MFIIRGTGLNVHILYIIYYMFYIYLLFGNQPNSVKHCSVGLGDPCQSSDLNEHCRGTWDLDCSVFKRKRHHSAYPPLFSAYPHLLGPRPFLGAPGIATRTQAAPDKDLWIENFQLRALMRASRSSLACFSQAAVASQHRSVAASG